VCDTLTHAAVATRHLSLAEIELVHALAATGLKRSEIARQLGTTWSRVTYALSETGRKSLERQIKSREHKEKTGTRIVYHHLLPSVRENELVVPEEVLAEYKLAHSYKRTTGEIHLGDPLYPRSSLYKHHQEQLVVLYAALILYSCSVHRAR
jgi:hypothetical protein